MLTRGAWANVTGSIGSMQMVETSSHLIDLHGSGSMLRVSGLPESKTSLVAIGALRSALRSGFQPSGMRGTAQNPGCARRGVGRSTAQRSLRELQEYNDGVAWGGMYGEMLKEDDEDAEEEI